MKKNEEKTKYEKATHTLCYGTVTVVLMYRPCDVVAVQFAFSFFFHSDRHSMPDVVATLLFDTIADVQRVRHGQMHSMHCCWMMGNWWYWNHLCPSLERGRQ
jgi:hypothetical protein